MVRKMEIVLEKRGVRCVAELLDDRAPKTCEAMWAAMPVGGQAYHAKYASNEVYCLVAPFAESEPGQENSTIAPAAGDVVYFRFPPGHVKQPELAKTADRVGMVDLALFYAPNNLLLSPATGFVPGNVFARITENFEAMAAACDSIWREGFVDERLVYSRLE